MNSGQTSSPLPSFKSLRCFRWGVRVFLGPESECFELSEEDEDIDGKKAMMKRERRKGLGTTYILVAHLRYYVWFRDHFVSQKRERRQGEISTKRRWRPDPRFGTK
jgi:hypothetical protein